MAVARLRTGCSPKPVASVPCAPIHSSHKSAVSQVGYYSSLGRVADAARRAQALIGAEPAVPSLRVSAEDAPLPDVPHQMGIVGDVAVASSLYPRRWLASVRSSAPCWGPVKPVGRRVMRPGDVT
jgi:hypothetical protein